jgi:hypothetical protein
MSSRAQVAATQPTSEAKAATSAPQPVDDFKSFFDAALPGLHFREPPLTTQEGPFTRLHHWRRIARPLRSFTDVVKEKRALLTEFNDAAGTTIFDEPTPAVGPLPPQPHFTPFVGYNQSN